MGWLSTNMNVSQSAPDFAKATVGSHLDFSFSWDNVDLIKEISYKRECYKGPSFSNIMNKELLNSSLQKVKYKIKMSPFEERITFYAHTHNNEKCEIHSIHLLPHSGYFTNGEITKDVKFIYSDCIVTSDAMLVRNQRNVKYGSVDLISINGWEL